MQQVSNAATLAQNANCTVSGKGDPELIIACDESTIDQDNSGGIVIDSDAVIVVTAANNTSPVTALDGGSRDNSMVNFGEIYLQVASAFNNLPQFAVASRHDSGHYKPKNWLFPFSVIVPDAIGITGGHGRDSITNHGLLDVSATTLIEDEPGLAQSYAVGIAGDHGHDRLVNAGTLTVSATAAINVSDVDISLLESGDARRAAEAVASGMTGGDGHDEIVNEGQISVSANATVDTTNVNVALIGGAVDIDTSSIAQAGAVGLDGGDGHDHIRNLSSMTVTADATVDSTDVGISLFSALWGESVRAPISAEAVAIGIHGGDGHDSIENASTLSVSANARANALDLDFSAVDISSGGMSTSSRASAIGIDGGQGKSEIVNSGTVNTNSSATTDTDTVAFTLIDLSLIPDIAGSAGDTSTTAYADAVGIMTGFDHDLIVNNGILSVIVDANTNTFELSLSADGVSNLTDASEFLDFFRAEPAIDASTTGEAYATGISSGHGHDDIQNTDSVFVRATADVTANRVGVDIPFPDLIPPVLPSIDTTEVETSAYAFGAGIRSADGHDKISNSGDIWAEAIANAFSLSVGATIGAPVPGPDYGIPYSLEANLVDIGARSEARALGVETGEGNDNIYSSGDITARAASDSNAANIDATLAYADDKVALGVSMANASTEGIAGSVAISSGIGNDTLHNSGDVLADALVDANSTAVAVSIEATKDTVLDISASLTRASTLAQASSTGVDLGTGNDEAHNRGSITATVNSYADADAVDVGITIPTGDEFGIVGQGTWVSSNTIASATADGMLGGAGRDVISNAGTITADAFADPNSISVAVNASGTKKGASLGIALTEAVTEGTATSTGISGGEDGDKLSNTGSIHTTARTDVDAISVAVSLALTDKGVALTGTAADGSTHAVSTATGISGGDGGESIKNEGTVDVLADADAETVSVSVAAQGASQGVALGVALSRAASEAEATSLGIGGGSDNDEIYNLDLVKSHATANLVAGSGALAAGGGGTGLAAEGAAADASTIGRASATGVSGDEGDDRIVNQGVVDVLAENTATSVSVGVAANGTGTGVALGVGLARATSEAETNSSGIRGSEGRDEIVNQDTVKSHSFSTVIAGSGALAAGGTGTGVTLEGAAADGLSRGYATAYGISGDQGKDIVQSDGVLDVYSEANTTSVSVAVSANGTGTGVSAGVALARATSEAEASSTGISGGDENDIISSTNRITAHAVADVDAVSVSAAMGGTGTGVAIEAAAADASTVGMASSTGVNGDAGIDTVTNEATLDVLADAAATSVSVGVSVSGTGAGVGLGVSLARTDTQAIANATGISLGAAEDVTENNDKADDVSGKNNTPGEGTGVALQGNKRESAEQTDGENADKHKDTDQLEQKEYLENSGDIISTALANADSVSVSVQLGITGTGLQAGGALADAGTRASARAATLEGSQHGDIIINRGSIESIADADATTTSVAVSLNASLQGASLSAAVTDATANATATSIGIAGLSGNDEISNQANITTTATAETDATSVSIPIGISFVPLSAGVADTDATATALAMGIDGGDGHDYLGNSSSVVMSADSTADGISVGIAPIGVSLVGADITANATTVGMHGGSGNDYISQDETANVDATSTAHATGTVVSVTLLGAAGTITENNNSTAVTQSTGLSGGAGFDRIENAGSINVNASSTATGTSVGVSLIGAAFADLTTRSISNATGIGAGNDHDKVINHGQIFVDAQSVGQGTSVAAGLIGYFDADASTIVEARAAGIELGIGDDTLLNTGDMNVSAKTRANLTAGSGGLIGQANSSTNINSETLVQGISGGEGDDLIINQAAITVGPASASDPWMSRLVSTSFSLSLIGVASAGSEISSSTESTGLDGGAGNDRIFNEDALDVTASSYSASSSTSFTLAGAASSSGAIVTHAYAIGMNAGSGADFMANTGGIDVQAQTYASSSASSLSILGGANTSSGIIGSATAIGMAGGGGEGDSIINQSSINVHATSSARANGDSFSLIGGASSDAFITAYANGAGITGSAGDDVLRNNGTITVNASSTAASGQDASVGLFGDVSTNADMIVNALARGMTSDAGNDSVKNEGDITVSVISTGAANSDSQTGVFEGDGDSDAKGDVTATGIGFEIATGNNWLYNAGSMEVFSSATMTATATADGSNFADGNGVADADAKSRSFNYGVLADEGNNQIFNDGAITLSVTTTASASTNADGDGAFGFGDGRATTRAGNGAQAPEAIGIRLGDGNHSVANLGTIAVNLAGTATSSARSDGDLVTSSANSAAISSQLASVYGIQVGDGDQTIYNGGAITVEAAVHASAYAIANPSADPDGYGNSDATTTTMVDGTAISTGSGQNQVINDGTININLNANPGVSRTIHDSHADGDGDARYSTADTISTASVTGNAISTASTGGLILNLGDIQVETQAKAAPFTNSKSDWTADTNGTGRTNVSAVAKGIVVTGEDNSIVNEGVVTVTAGASTLPTVVADTWGTDSDADAKSENLSSVLSDGMLVTGLNNTLINRGDIVVAGHSSADALVRSYATGGTDANADVLSVSHATATANANGIRAVDGADAIINYGNVEVNSTTDGRMDSDAIGGWADGDARAYATGVAQASAFGIRSDELSIDNEMILNDYVVNKGSIMVTTNATAFASAWAEEDAGGTSDELASGTANAAASSYGIFTGNGNDTVINRGMIDVSAVANASLSVDTEDNDREYRTIMASAIAAGIYTGAGDDVIEQQGIILTSHTLNGVSGAGAAIDTGSGNDTVILGEISSTTGSIVLGENDDSLHIINAPVVNGRISGGAGIDTVYYFGSGTFENPLEPDFESVIKKGDGTYTLAALPPMQSITVENGVLEINSNYEFAAGSSFMPSVSSGEGRGTLVINGAIDITAAAIKIMKGDGHHRDGERQVVLRADNDLSAIIDFDELKVPDATPLLSFSPEVAANDLVVHTSVRGFNTVAANNNELAIANYLELLLPDASGDISLALGEIQATAAGGHARAFKSLSPESHVNAQQAVAAGINHVTSTVQQRIRGLRNMRSYSDFLQPGFFTYEQGQPFVNLPDHSATSLLNFRQGLLRQHGAWFKGFHQTGRLDSTASNTGFDFDTNGIAFGVDKWLTRNRVIGFSMADSRTDMSVAENDSHSDIDSRLFSAYATHMTDAGYVEGSLGFGRNVYITRRTVTVGSITDTVLSEHDGDSYAASAGAGLFFPVRTWRMELYSALNYQHQKEEGFTENGAGGISLSVDPRSTEALLSEFGLRFGRQFKERYSHWYAEAGLAWTHEFMEDTAVKASFIDGTGNYFAVDGQKIADDGFLLNLGLNYLSSKGVTASAEYRTEQRGQYSDNVISAHYHYQF